MTITTQAFKFSDGTSFEMPALPTEELTGEANQTILAATVALDDTIMKARAIAADEHLSATGKTAKTEPVASRAWEALILAHQKLDEQEKSVQADDAILLAVPDLPGNEYKEAIADREAREWWRSQPAETRAKLLRGFEEDEATSGKYARLQLALLRTPIPLPDMESGIVKSLWERGRRLDNPAEALRIARVKSNIEWARRALGHIQGFTSRVTGWNGERLAQYLAADEGRTRIAGRLGFSPQQMALEIRKSAASGRVAR